MAKASVRMADLEVTIDLIKKSAEWKRKVVKGNKWKDILNRRLKMYNAS